MKFNREPTLIGKLLTTFAKASSVDITEIVVTPLELQELIDVGAAVTLSAGDTDYYLDLSGYDLETEAVPFRVEANDKHTRARKVVKGDGRINTR